MAFDLQVVFSGMMALARASKGVLVLMVDMKGHDHVSAVGNNGRNGYGHSGLGSQPLEHHPYLRIADSNEAWFEDDNTTFRDVAEPEPGGGWHRISLKDKWEISFLDANDNEVNGGEVAVEEARNVAISPVGGGTPVVTSTQILRLGDVDQNANSVRPDLIEPLGQLTQPAIALLASRIRLRAGTLRPLDGPDTHHRILAFEPAAGGKYSERLASQLELSKEGLDGEALRIRLTPLPGSWLPARTLQVQQQSGLVQVGFFNEPTLKDFCSFCCDAMRLEHTKVYFDMAGMSNNQPSVEVDYSDGYYETITRECKAWEGAPDEGMGGKYPIICYKPLLEASSI
nr:hypothetical protein [Thermoanaerobaculia bacterium]